MASDENLSESLSLDEIDRLLGPYSPHQLTRQQLASTGSYLQLLKRWNRTIPLTSIGDDAEVVTRHFGEGIFAGSIMVMSCGRLADVGAGAGFPGLALKIAFPELHVTLIEPNLKKCAFLREVRDALGLSGVEIVRSRYEEFLAERNSFDFISSRALGGYKRLLQWAKPLLNPTGHAVLWLGEEDSNLVSRTKGWTWRLPVRIPESRRRVLLSGTPTP